MNRLQPLRFSMVVLVLFMGALVGGSFYFIVGMGHTTYLVTDGVRVGMQYLDKPRYDMHLQGLIFSLSFLIAGALLLLLVILPDREGRAARGGEAPPQPRRRPDQAGEAPQPAAAAAAPQPAQAAPPAAPLPQAQAAASTSPLSIESGEGEAEPAAAPAQPQPQAQAQPQRPGVSVEEEVLQSAAAAPEDLPTVDFGDSRFEDTGEEDVVYGNGRVTEDAVWEFVQQYPDSAVKFLYRKTLDNKPLSPTEEDIYRAWEQRGMSRAKVREIVLEIMRWQSLPDNFPHEIWRELRDQIYEIKTR